LNQFKSPCFNIIQYLFDGSIRIFQHFADALIAITRLPSDGRFCPAATLRHERPTLSLKPVGGSL